jgi:cytochrome b561
MMAARFPRWMRRSIDVLGSGRLAVVLLTLAVWLLGLYLLIPQRGQVEEGVLLRWVELNGLVGRLSHSLGFTDVLHSWSFWGLYGLLLVNLLVCMVRRLPTVARLCRFPDRPPQVSSVWLQRTVEVDELGSERIAALLQRKGYRTRVAESTVYALRGRFASLGHWLFHASLLVLLIAGVFVAAAPDPFRGTIGVGEGEPFDLHAATFVSANGEVGPELPPLRFRLEQVHVAAEDEQVRDFEVALSTAAGDRPALRINRPYRKKPYQVVVHGFGYMVGWVIVNPRGRALKGAWVKLAPFPLQHQESFPLGAEESTVYVRFHPDYEQEEEPPRNSRRELPNPRFQTRILWKGQQVYEGLLEQGQRVQLQGGMDFFFLPEIRRYGMLDVIEERGHSFVFACLGIMIFGLFIRYARIRKQVLVQVGGRSLQVYGHGEIFESLFAEELDHLIGELATANRRLDARKGIV